MWPFNRKQKDRPYPWTDEEFGRFHEERWQELDPVLQAQAVALLKEKLEPQLLEEIGAAYVVNPNHWMGEIGKDILFYTFHFAEGMMIRNLLRTIILDDALPSGNWDDFYSSALERAAGCR